MSIGDKLSSLFAPSSTVQPITTPPSQMNQGNAAAYGAQTFGQGSGSSTAGGNMIAGTQIPSTGDPTQDALIAMAMSNQSSSSSNKWMAAISGLGPVAAALLDEKPELGKIAPPDKGAGPAMGPLPLAAGAQPASPITEAALIAELL